MACHAFQETLSDEALSWFLNLPPNSIDNFDQLSERFLNRFILHSRIYRSVDALFHIKQKEGEGFHELLSRWQSAMSRCHNLEPRVAEQAFRQALLPRSFVMEINRNLPRSYDALMDLAICWARAEFATFGHSNPTTTLALPAPPPKQQSLQKYDHYDRGQDKSKQHSSSRDNNQGRSSDRRHSGQRGRDHPYRSREQSPQQQQRRSPPPRYEVHTALTTTYEDIWTRHKDLIPPPPKSKYPKKPQRATGNKYCAYHDNNGHATEMCHGLRNATEHLIRNGQLHQYCTLVTGANAIEVHGQILTIHGGAPRFPPRQPSVKWQCTSHLEILELQRGVTTTPSTWDQVSFYKREDTISCHHNEPFIINVQVDHYRCHRALVDTGATVSVMFADCYRGLWCDRAKLYNNHDPLVSFSGEIVQPLGSDRLTVSVGTSPCRASIKTRFLIVDCPSSYNLILGRDILWGL
uniref:uncharacterized protein LOC105351277 n=1 Tax=Fragaria vesca subsp. vesca TaxID=101020 RepID=UPI0005CA1D8F|nr:PREDICTED: uncharacterized protein LOC105351277 [Fragaria vesca subsp. vesca]